MNVRNAFLWSLLITGPASAQVPHIHLSPGGVAITHAPKKKPADDRQTISDLRKQIVEKDKEIAALKAQVADLQSQLHAGR